MQYADIKFEPAIGTNGKPLAFDYTNIEFANTFCPLIRFAYVITGWDQDRVRKFVHDMTSNPDDPDADPLFALLHDWKSAAEKFEALAELIRIAEARMITTMSAIDEALAIAEKEKSG
jgi:hypothetical protein